MALIIQDSSIIESIKYLQTGKIGLLTGRSKIFKLSHFWMFHLLLQKYNIYVIDCAIRFNAFLISDESLRHYLPVEEILNRILVQRAFTPYQILDVVHQISEADVDLNQNRVYFLLAPFKQFFDGDVHFDEGLFLLEKLVIALKDLRRKNIFILLVEKDNYSTPVFYSIYKQIQEVSHPIWKLEEVMKDKKRHHLLTIKR